MSVRIAVKMAKKIHRTAVVSPQAQIGEDVVIGSYCVVGADVTLGAGTVLGSHVVLEGRTTLGRRCEVFHGACLGGKPQDKKFKNREASVVIGDENVIREYVTVHVSTVPGKATTIGHRNFFMVGAHVGHDCRIGNDVVIANNCALGGHVVVEDHAVLGGLSGVHQFCRVGKLAMVGGMSKVVMDVAPYSVCDGHPAKFCGVNSVGLKRAGYTSTQTSEIKRALKTLLASGGKLSSAIQELKGRTQGNPDLEALLLFCEQSERGVCRGVMKGRDDVA